MLVYMSFVTYEAGNIGYNIFLDAYFLLKLSGTNAEIDIHTFW